MARTSNHLLPMEIAPHDGRELVLYVDGVFLRAKFLDLSLIRSCGDAGSPLSGVQDFWILTENPDRRLWEDAIQLDRPDGWLPFEE